MARRSPAVIQGWLDENLHRFDLPVQFLGDEPNARRKDWNSATVRWCLVASWPYEQAAGNSSIPAVYCCINDANPTNLADRFYLPATPRDLKLLEKHGIPVFGIESKHQLGDFDAIGTSISYPVLAMSWIKLLAMSDIPVRWRDREAAGLENYPMVVAGGLSYGAPESLAPVVDCWWLGEAEDEPGNPGIAVVTDRIRRFKATGQWATERLRCYQELAREFRFLYFPRFVDVHYAYEDRTHAGAPLPSKQVVAVTSNLDGMRMPLTKRHVADLDAIKPLTAPPLLFADPAMGSGDLEVARGCPAWCSFCSLTYRQKPYRQRSVDYVVDYAKQFAANMGSARMAPFSPDFPMHTQRRTLIAALLQNVSDEVDAPTMRVDDFIADDKFILLQVHGGMDSLTLGVEGNSQRMRDLVGKGTSDADIREAVARGIRAGIRKIKLYMISNMPGETAADVMRILKLAKDLADIRDSMNQSSVRIQFSWTPLMIEANTPMQWFAPTTQSRILGDVWDEFRDLKIDFKVGAKGEINKTTLFQLCQRASRSVGEAIVDAMTLVDKACWGGVPRTLRDILAEQLRRRGFHNGFMDCFDERDRTDLFGWEMIDQGISVDLMWSAHLQMREFLLNTDAHTYDTQFDASYHGNEWIERCDTRCYGKTCGACSHRDLTIRMGYIQAAQREVDTDISTLRVVDQRTQAQRVRVRLLKPDRYRFVDNSHWRHAVRRAAFRAQAELGTTHGIAKRSLRFASDETRHRDWTSGVDYLEFAFTRILDQQQVTDYLHAMNRHLTSWVQITDWVVQPANAATLRTYFDLALAELELDTDPGTVIARLDAWAATTYVPMRLKVEGGYFAPTTEQVNAHDYVDDLWLITSEGRLKLRMLIRGRPSPYNVYAALMARPSWIDAARIPAVRLEAFVKLDRYQQDFLRPNCQACRLVIPTTLLDRPYHRHYCPHCKDTADGITLTSHGRPTMTESNTTPGDQNDAAPDAGNTENIDALTEELDPDDDAYARVAMVNTSAPDLVEEAPADEQHPRP
jgi:hypothetical protein